MKAEAEQNAAADKAEREKIDKMNQADSMIFTTENFLKDNGDKIPADKKPGIEQALQQLKDAHKAGDVAAIDSAINNLNTVMQAASQQMYQGGQQAGPQGAQGGQQAQDGNDGAQGLRYKPWHALAGFVSFTGVTMTSASFTSTFTRSLISCLSSPFGPFTVTKLGATVTVTPAGIATGSFPILDAISSSYYHTLQINSPPTIFSEAFLPVVTPLDVETIKVPYPL